MTTRLILDVDTGTDDAVAIMSAALHPDLELLAVTTVNGNVPLPNTTENTLRVLDHIGRGDVPVHSGAARPFARTDFPVPRRLLNGENAIHPDYLDLPPIATRGERARDELGWRPMSLQEGLRDSWEWYRGQRRPRPGFSLDDRILASAERPS